jgi:flagellar basal body P-ring protein FlgI
MAPDAAARTSSRPAAEFPTADSSKVICRGRRSSPCRDLLLRDPDVGTASRIAAAIDTALGAGTAKVEDPGAIALTLKEGDPAAQIAKIRDLTVRVVTPGRIVIDAHDGTVVAGGELPVGPAW